MNECVWFSIEAAELVGSSGKGQLYAIASKLWSADFPDGNYNRPAQKTGGDKTSIAFVFCSKQAPAWIDKQEGEKWSALPLQPGNKHAVFGFSETAYALYWAACHHAIVKNVYDDGDQLGKKLGYHFEGDPAQQEARSIETPFDVLKW